MTFRGSDEFAQGHYDHATGRWLCKDMTQVQWCYAEGDYHNVYLYDRDADGKMVNIRKVDPPDENPIQGIKNGKIIWR